MDEIGVDSTFERLLHDLDEKIKEGQFLLASNCSLLESRQVAGIEKLKRRIQVELINLEQFKTQKKVIQQHHIDGNNLVHFKALCDVALQYDTCEILASHRRKNGSIFVVDIVANSGNTWVKTIARNAKGLHMSFTGESYSKEKNIVRQALDYLYAAKNNFHHYKQPQIIFEFVASLTEPVKRKLMTLGINVKGNVIPVPTICDTSQKWNFDDDPNSDFEFDSNLDFDDEHAKIESFCSACFSREIEKSRDLFESIEETPEDLPADVRDEDLKINLDITALFAFVSNLTNGHANFRFKSPMLDEQASFERSRPVLPFLKKVTQNRRLICCNTAFNSFNDILSTVGGKLEKNRAKDFFKNVEIVEDGILGRIENLHVGGNIKNRSKIIFGSGEFHRAITLTANKSFVGAAETQGFKFVVILHESRALSEQKQQTAVIL